jgi:hypothetical protein
MSKKVTYSLRCKGETLLNTQFKNVAIGCAVDYFADMRSVSMIDNSTGRTVQHFIYGRAQKG